MTSKESCKGNEGIESTLDEKETLVLKRYWSSSLTQERRYGVMEFRSFTPITGGTNGNTEDLIAEEQGVFLVMRKFYRW